MLMVKLQIILIRTVTKNDKWETRQKLYLSSPHRQHLAEYLPVAGDFEMQIAITESLARLVKKSERKKYCTSWFKSDSTSKAFLNIQDQQFDSVRSFDIIFSSIYTQIQSNRPIAATHGKQKKWPLLTGGCYSQGL